MSKVTTYYLEMTSPPPPGTAAGAPGLEIRECVAESFTLNQLLYRLVGGPWQWVDRLRWTDEQWSALVEDEHLRTWVAYVDASPAGYFELHRQQGGDVEILYFGLAPEFIGRGFGRALLDHALQSAWAWEGTRRVWVHTCSLDHPGALQNYQARGMKIYRETTGT